MLNKQEPFKTRFVKALEIRDKKCADICKMTGIRDSTLSQYKSGYAEPKADKLQIIAKALNVNPVWLMGMDVPMEVERVEHTEENASILANLMKDARQFDYIKKITELPTEKKEVLYNYIDFLRSTP